MDAEEVSNGSESEMNAQESEESESEVESLDDFSDFVRPDNDGQEVWLHFNEDGCDDSLRRWVDEIRSGGSQQVQTVVAHFEMMPHPTLSNLDPLLDLLSAGDTPFSEFEIQWLEDSDIFARLLQAIAQNNGSIRKLSLKWSNNVHVAALTNLFGTNDSSLDHLVLYCTFVEGLEGPELTQFQRTIRTGTNIKKLELSNPRDNVLVPTMLQLPCLQELSLNCEDMKVYRQFDDAKAALEDLLRTSRSLQHLALGSYLFKEREDFVLQNLLIRSPSLTKLTFKDCRSSSFGHFDFLGPILRSNPKIRSLVLKLYIFDDLVSQNNLQRILGPGSGIKNLSIELERGARASCERYIAPMMSILGSPSSLEYLDTGFIRSVDAYNTFVHGVRKLANLQELRFEIAPEIVNEISVETLVAAVRGNLSLKRVVCKTPVDLFRGREHQLQRIADRNEMQILACADPHSIPPHAWPTLWNVLLGCEHGHGPVFRSLIELGDKVGLSETQPASDGIS